MPSFRTPSMTNFPLRRCPAMLTRLPVRSWARAANLKNLDLVITSDTALPHLAGAFGIPIRVALPFAPDWRWLLEREDSPWYATMRLWRQKTR